MTVATWWCSGAALVTAPNLHFLICKMGPRVGASEGCSCSYRQRGAESPAASAPCTAATTDTGNTVTLTVTEGNRTDGIEPAAKCFLCDSTVTILSVYNECYVVSYFSKSLKVQAVGCREVSSHRPREGLALCRLPGGEEAGRKPLPPARDRAQRPGQGGGGDSAADMQDGRWGRQRGSSTAVTAAELGAASRGSRGCGDPGHSSSV